MQRRLAACGAVLLAAGLGVVLAGGPPAVAADTAPTGFAAVNALGQNGTTGGAGGRPSTVTTATDFIAAIAPHRPADLRVQGTITLLAAATTACTRQLGQDDRRHRLRLPASPAAGSTSAWPSTTPSPRRRPTPCTTSSSATCRSAARATTRSTCRCSPTTSGSTTTTCRSGVRRPDRHQARLVDYVTVSWNHTHDHTKNMLLGHDDGNGAQDIGRLKVTYHHNWFDGTRQRNPRVRFGEPVHVYNNYYLQHRLRRRLAMNAGVPGGGQLLRHGQRPRPGGLRGDLGRFVARGTPSSTCTTRSRPVGRSSNRRRRTRTPSTLPRPSPPSCRPVPAVGKI